MNKRFTLALALLALLAATSACTGKDPQRKGNEAGKAMCECYKLESSDEVEACLNKIESENGPVENIVGIPFSATVSLGDNAATKALAESGSTIVAAWAKGEKVALIHNGVSDEMASFLCPLCGHGPEDFEPVFAD